MKRHYEEHSYAEAELHEVFRKAAFAAGSGLRHGTFPPEKAYLFT
jgi:hypothetical protein